MKISFNVGFKPAFVRPSDSNCTFMWSPAVSSQITQEAVWMVECDLCPCDLVCICKCVCGPCVLIQANGPLCLRRGLRPHTADLRVAIETTRVTS